MKSHNLPSQRAGLLDVLKAWPQYLLPHYLLSNVMYTLTRARNRAWKNTFIRWFIRQYQVDMSQANNEDINHYANFNEFFTRPLKPDARPIDPDLNTVVCPVDGRISQLGKIDKGRIFQAKGHSYSLSELLGGAAEQANQFVNGMFVTIYLSPRDYHRIHMPMAGHLLAMSHIPGRLFSVNAATTRAVPRLFARNERVISYFYTTIGCMAMVLVGALFVGSMETVWHGVVTPPHGGRAIKHWQYQSMDPSLDKEKEATVQLGKGDEMGRFNMGSTVILLFEENTVQWQSQLQTAPSVRLGQTIASITK